MRALWQRILAFVRGRRMEEDLSAEIESHLAMQEAEFRAQGMDSVAARAAARREFGGVAQAMEDYRERRGLPWLETLARDTRYAVRGLRHNPGFTAAAVLSLALGIGANTAIFSLFHALMLRLLPVERPQELVSLYRTGGWGKATSSYPLYREIAKRADLFTGVIARTGVDKVRFSPRSGAREEYAQREFVSGNYFAVLGVAPALGRVFTDEDDRTPGAHPLAVLSYDLWRSRYDSEPAIVGEKILVAEQPMTVIGVAARGFHGVEVERRAEIWVPIKMSGSEFENPRSWWLTIMARRRPEISVHQAQAAIDILMAHHLEAIYPAKYNAAFRKRALGQRLEVREGNVGFSGLREMFAKPLTVLMIGVGLVLLAACVNVANLLLARGAVRRKETALRLSLGASRGRLLSQALTESILLVLGGGALGWLLSIWGRRVIVQFLPLEAGDPFGGGPDNAVGLFGLGISTVSVLLFGLLPAVRSTSIDPLAGLRTANPGRAGRLTLRRALVVAQVAFSVMLVALATLFGHNLYDLRSVDLGFAGRNTIAFGLDFPRRWQGDAQSVRRQFVTRMESLPGVSSVSYGFPGPFMMGWSDASIRVPGSERTEAVPVDVETHYVGARYFETIDSPPIQGREFDRTDTVRSTKVAVVNEAFLREFLSSEPHPLSRWLSFDDSKQQGGERVQIVGIVRDIRHSGIAKESRPTVYIPAVQKESGWPPTILVRTTLPPSVLLRRIYGELSGFGSAIAVTDIETLQQHIDDSIFEQRMLAALGGFFGTLALILAVVGLYGVVAYGTARRSGEIGIRIALGARRGQVTWMILRDSLALVAIGLVVGLPAALAAARTVESVLFGIKPGDPVTFVSTAVILAGAGVAAAFLPARRAARLEPSQVLRHE
jgi:predicted permease